MLETRRCAGPIALGCISLIVCPAAWTQRPNAEADVTIDSHSAVTIVESPQESGPVRRATADLLGDFTKVLGQAPRLVRQLEEAGPVAILIAENSTLPEGVKCSTATDTEAFAFSSATVRGQEKPQRLIYLSRQLQS